MYSERNHRDPYGPCTLVTSEPPLPRPHPAGPRWWTNPVRAAGVHDAVEGGRPPVAREARSAPASRAAAAGQGRQPRGVLILGSGTGRHASCVQHAMLPATVVPCSSARARARAERSGRAPPAPTRRHVDQGTSSGQSGSLGVVWCGGLITASARRTVHARWIAR